MYAYVCLGGGRLKGTKMFTMIIEIICLTCIYSCAGCRVRRVRGRIIGMFNNITKVETPLTSKVNKVVSF